MTTPALQQDRTRLTPRDWIAAGFRALAEGGAPALRVEPLARGLGTSKGSFYWHFADLAALKAQMVALWQRLAEEEITASVMASGAEGRGALQALIGRISVAPPAAYGGAGVEPALRGWARTEPHVAQAVAAMDARRLVVLEGFFAQAGHADPAQAARLFYAATLGLMDLRLTTGADMRAGLEAQLDALLP